MKKYKTAVYFDGDSENDEVENGRSALDLYLSEIRGIKFLSPKEIVRQVRLLRNGKTKARDKVVKTNLLLVVSIANQYANMGLSLLDLIQEGNLGLMRAVERFDPDRSSFRYYADWWIRKFIRRALSEQSRTIRISVGTVEGLLKVRKVSTKLWGKLGREPTDGELLDELSFKKERFDFLRANEVSCMSLDVVASTNDNGEEVTFLELMPDEGALSPSDVIETESIVDALHEAIQKLSRRERTIIRERFCFNGGSAKTLDEVGEMLGITGEYVRQLQNRAVKKLRGILEAR